MRDHSPASIIVERLVYSFGIEGARRALDATIARFSAVELAALAARWEFWARSKQLAPRTEWRSWGFLTGRGFGKTIAVGKHINEEVFAGRARLICLLAQDEASAVKIQVKGASGLIQTAPPWFRPEWIASELQLVWPNGARAYVNTPEVPGKIRGLDYHLTWATEFQSWPRGPGDKQLVEAYTNAVLATRLGYARLIWDATPKRGHPILVKRLRMALDEPEMHVVVRGSTDENQANLGPGYIEEMQREFGGGRFGEISQKGREELLGEMLTDTEGAIFRIAWINERRASRPPRFVRRAIGVDPAVTTRMGSDLTGIVLGGLGADARLAIMADRTGKHEAHAWAAIVLDLYGAEECDVVVVETNKGGNLLTQNLRAAAAARGLRVEVVDDKWQPQRVAGVVFVREIFSKGAKEDRAQPVATAYERGRVYHLLGAELDELESEITTWEPVAGGRSPNRLDALVSVAKELLGIRADEVDNRGGFAGITQLAKQLEHGTGSGGVNLAALLGGGDGGRI